MMTAEERKILEIIGEKLLVRPEELRALNGSYDKSVLQKLKEMGLIEIVNAGHTCFTITKKGMKVLKG
jgi:ribosomal protein S19E (S16A)